MNRQRARLARALLGAAMILGASPFLPARARAQEPERPVDGRGGCDLVYTSTSPQTRSRITRDPGASDSYITTVWGGMRWTCGDAVMTADSAVKYDREERVELIGTVNYRDTTRTLRARHLTYFAPEDRIVATGNAVLTRLATGSVLRGPRVTFFRTVRSTADRTVATGRPHVTMRPPSGGEPFEVDADRTVFIGDDRARAVGQVVIHRSDVDARADSARFRLAEGLGFLYGSAWVRGEDFQLTGDSIRVGFEGEELTAVHAYGESLASGEEFELAAEQVEATLQNEEVDELWAYGGGRSVGLSGRYRIAADSLHFAFGEGALDSVVAVGSATAVELDSAVAVGLEPLEAAADSIAAGADSFAVAADSSGTSDPALDAAATLRTSEPPLDAAGGESWLAGDLIVAYFIVPTKGADPAGAEDTERPETGMVQDTVRIVVPVPVSPPDSAANDTTALAADTTGFADTTALAADTAAAAEGAPADTVGGDTLALAEIAFAGLDTVASVGQVGDPALLRAIGNARSFYASGEEGEGKRFGNYVIGRVITVQFMNGEVEAVLGYEAVGVYLEPDEGGAPPDETRSSSR